MNMLGHQGPRKIRSVPIKKERSHWKAAGFLEACNTAIDWYSSCIFLDSLKRQAGC